MEKLIEVKNLSFNYGKDLILENVNFNIYRNRNVAIIGRNGGGKSTLIKILLKYLKKSKGEIEYYIKENKIGYLPQIREFDTTFPISIFDLVISGLVNKKNLFKKYSEVEKNKTMDILEKFEIDNLKNKLIGEVSGGQLQRALIARAIISNPEILFLDEPESFLDKKFEFELFDKIKELSDSTLVIISHSLDKLCCYVDSIFVIEKNGYIFENKEDFFKSEFAKRHLHSHIYGYDGGKK